MRSIRMRRLGPFATESECNSMLESIQGIPRFSSNPLAVLKRRRRRDKRIKVKLSVYFRRPATDEEPRRAHTVDVSKSGARLAGLTEPMRLGDFLDIRCGDLEARFQVVWAGSPAADGQIGIESLAPEVNIWGLDPSQQTEDELRPNEIAVASAVQTRLLPQELVQLRTLDYRGHCIQARTVGGDYYDFLDMGSGSVGLVLADIAGKGVAAALLMANLQGSLHSEAGIGAQDLPQMLASVNRHFYKRTDSHRYATLFVACYDDVTQKLRYVNCGHNPPLCCTKTEVWSDWAQPPQYSDCSRTGSAPWRKLRWKPGTYSVSIPMGLRKLSIRMEKNLGKQVCWRCCAKAGILSPPPSCRRWRRQWNNSDQVNRTMM
jgi:Stage II sporulation protein E (SpoIIE)/PilZ domain